MDARVLLIGKVLQANGINDSAMTASGATRVARVHREDGRLCLGGGFQAIFAA